LPDSGTERPHSVNDFETCNSSNWSETSPFYCILKVLDYFIGQIESDILPARSSTWVSTEHYKFYILHCGLSKRDGAVNGYITSCVRLYRLRRTESVGHSIENALNCDCPVGYRGNILCLSLCNGCQLQVYRCVCSIANWITQDARPKIVVALLIFNDMMGQRVCSSLFCLYRQPILWWYIPPTNAHFTYLTYGTIYRWHSVNSHFTIGATAIINHSHWHGLSIMVLW